MRDLEPELMKLVRAIVAGDEATVSNRLATTPALAHARFERGATRQEADVYFIDAIKRYIVADDTARCTSPRRPTAGTLCKRYSPRVPTFAPKIAGELSLFTLLRRVCPARITGILRRRLRP